MKSYIYSDNNETITIVQNDISNNYILQCNEELNNVISHRKVFDVPSPGAIIGIICGIIGVLILTAIVYIFVRRCRKRKIYENAGNTNNVNANSTINIRTN